MKVSDYVARFLAARGLHLAFDLPGGMISHLTDSVAREKSIRLVTMHHEQGVAFAVDGASRTTGTPAVGFATVGPGAINLLTGIASCYCDSVPALFITGNVPTYQQRGTRPLRQFGWQECDLLPMAVPVTKAAWSVQRAADVPAELDRALALTMEGRPGPVLLELPTDVQSGAVDREPSAGPVVVERPTMDEGEVRSVLDELAAAERPAIIAGGGLRSARAIELARRFARATRLPVLMSNHALDVLPSDDPLRVGFLGMFGRRSANLTFHRTDALLVLGSRLEPGKTGADAPAFRRGRKIIQIDCDAGEVEARFKSARHVRGDVASFLSTALRLVEGTSAPPSRDVWLDEVASLRAAHPDTAELDGCEGINPNVFLRAMSMASIDRAVSYVLDNGLHLWWACQSLVLGEAQQCLSATGMGSIGFGLPAAIGASLSRSGPVVLIVGDGALQANIQELQTVVRNELPIKIVVLNNRCHASVRQLQDEVFEGRYPSTLWGYSAPSFARVADAYGIRSRAVDTTAGTADALKWLWEEPARPALLEVAVSPYLSVFPNVPLGAPLNQMQSYRPGQAKAQ